MTWEMARAFDVDDRRLDIFPNLPQLAHDLGLTFNL